MRAARKEKEKENFDIGEGSRQNAPSPVPLVPAVLSSPAIPPQVSPHVSPAATPTAQSSDRLASFPDLEPPPWPDENRQRELSVDRPIRAGSPAGRIAANFPLPASPSDTSSGGRDRSVQSRNAIASPTLGSSQSLGNSFSPSSSRGAVGLGVGPVGLGVPTTKADRRRSINPAMTFNMDAANNTFAVEPRLSPLPPSPLRASFTDAQTAQHTNAPLRSPTSPTPTYLGGDGFPFKTTAPLTTSPRSSESGHGPPTRTSSLPDQLTGRQLDELAEEDETPERSPPRLPPKSGMNEDDSTPRLHAPDLPPMTFSLSDPDFAVILNNIDHSPDKADRTPRIGTFDTNRSEKTSPSSPSSPRTSPSLARSPQMETLSTAVDETPATSRSPSRTRLSPGDSSTPHRLRVRQPSAESTTSVHSRALGPDSAFAQILEVVAGARHGTQDSVQVSLGVLNGIVGEVEDLRDALSGMKNKYTGVKVGFQPNTHADE